MELDSEKIFDTEVKKNKLRRYIYEISAAMVDSKVSPILLIILDAVSLLQTFACIHTVWKSQIAIIDTTYSFINFPSIAMVYSPNYYIYILVGIFGGCLLLRVGGFIAYLLKKKDAKESTISNMNYILMHIDNSLFSIPIWYFTIILLSCKSTQSCWTGGHLLVSILMIVVILVHSLLSTLSIHLVITYYFKSEIYAKWTPCLVKYLRIIKNIALSLCASGVTRTTQIILLLIITLVDLINLAQLFKLPNVMNKAGFIMMNESSISSLLYCVATYYTLALSSKFSICTLVIVLICALISVFVLIIYYSSETQSSISYAPQSSSSLYCYIYYAIKLLKNKETCCKSHTLLIQHYQFHLFKCIDSQCICRKSLPIFNSLNDTKVNAQVVNPDQVMKFYNDWTKLFKELFESLAIRNEKSFILKLCLSAYYKLIEKNNFKSYFILLSSMNLALDLSDDFIVYKEIVRIDKSIKKYESKMKLDIYRVATYEYYLDHLTLSIDNTIQNTINFYNYLLLSIDKPESLQSIGVKLLKYTQQFFSNFKKIQQLFNDSILVFRIYSKYNKIILRNELEAYFASELANGIERTLQINRRMRTNFDIIYSHNSDTLVIAISGMESKLGIVELVNNSIKKLGYEKSEVKLNNISRIIPNIIAAEHNEFLRNFLSTGHSILIGKPRTVFAQCKNGLILPIQLYMRTYPGIQNGFHLISFISFNRHLIKSKFNKVPYELSTKRYNFILLSDNGIIQGLSEGTAKLFGLKKQYFQPNKSIFNESININKIIQNFDSEDVRKKLESGTEINICICSLFQYIDKDSVNSNDIEVIRQLPDIRVYGYLYSENFQNKLKIKSLLLIDCSQLPREAGSPLRYNEQKLDFNDQQSVSSSQNTITSFKQEARESKTAILNNKPSYLTTTFKRMFAIIFIEILFALLIFFTLSKLLFSKYVPCFSFLINLAYASELYCIAPFAVLTVANIDNGLELMSNEITANRRQEYLNISVTSNDFLKEDDSAEADYITMKNLTKVMYNKYENPIPEFIYYQSSYTVISSTFNKMLNTMLSSIALILTSGNLSSQYYQNIFTGKIASSNFTSFAERKLVWLFNNSINQIQDTYLKNRIFFSEQVNLTSKALSNWLSISLGVQSAALAIFFAMSIYLLRKLASSFLWIFRILAELNVSETRDYISKLKDYSSITENDKTSIIPSSTTFIHEENSPLLDPKQAINVVDLDEQFKSKQRIRVKKNKHKSLPIILVLVVLFTFFTIIVVVYYLFLISKITSMNQATNYIWNINGYRYISLVKALTVVKYKLMDPNFNSTFFDFFFNRSITTEESLYFTLDAMPSEMSSMKSVIDDHDSGHLCDILKDSISSEHYSKCTTILNGVLTKGLHTTIEKVISYLHEYKMLIESPSISSQSLHDILISSKFSEIEDLYIFYIRVCLDIQLRKALALLKTMTTRYETNFLLIFIALFSITVMVSLLIVFKFISMIENEITGYRGMVCTLPYAAISVKLGEANRIIFK